MADITSFKGVLYNQEKIRDVSKVVVPPYDVISPAEQAEFYGKSPYNIIRVLLGKDLAGDDGHENKYSRAAKDFMDWQKKEILKRDSRPSIYPYLQEFEIDGRIKKRFGFIALLKLEEFDKKTSTVYPHENTLAAPKEDRAKLIRAIEANLGPVFAIFSDEDHSVGKILDAAAESRPVIDIKDSHGIRHRLWRMSDEKTAGRLAGLMARKKLFIADGHHRYEVGLAFSRFKKDPRYGYILTYFTDLCGDGIVVLPVHRLIKGVPAEALSGFEEFLKKNFTVKKLASKSEAKGFLAGAGASEKRFVLYDGAGFRGISVAAKGTLDVTALHERIIEPLKGKIEAAGGEISIDFTKDLEYAVKEVKNGGSSLCILINPTKITEIRDVALSGKRMPQKSTYFYPKVLTGLVINVF